MKQTMIIIMALMGFVAVQAQEPAVNITVTGTGTTTITASFEMNETCTHYAILADQSGNMEGWASGPGSPGLSALLLQWGLHCTQDTVYTWSGFQPGMEYEVFVVAMSDTDTADVAVVTCTTQVAGGDGTSIIEIELRDITQSSVRMITTPNDQTALHYNGLVTVEFYNEVGQDSVVKIITSTPYVLYEADDHVWMNLNSGTDYYALAVGQNALGEWGEVAMTSFRTLSELGLNDISAEEIFLYPNPATGATELQNISKGSLISLTDVSGRLLRTFVSTGTSQKIELSELENGLYFVRVLSPESKKSFVYKLIVDGR